MAASTNRRLPQAALLLLLALCLAAGPGRAAPGRHVIVMDKMKFGAVPARVRPGDVIIWVNRDIVRHTATARNGSFNVDLRAGARSRMVVRRRGATEFFCRYHPGMKGRMVIA